MTSEHRYVKLGIEDTFGDGDGEVVSPSWIKVSEESIKDNMEWAQVEEVNIPSTEENYQASRSASGSFSMWGRADALSMVLYALFGSVEKYYSDGEESDDINFFFDPDIANLPSLEIDVGREEKNYSYKGMLMNGCEFSAEVGENLIITPDWLGLGTQDSEPYTTVKEGYGDANYVDPDTCPIFTMEQAAITLAGDSEACQVKALSIEMLNNIIEDDHGLGSLVYCAKPGAGRREINVTLDMRKEASDDPDLFSDFLNGTEAALDVIFTSPSLIGLSGNPYKLHIHIPRLQYQDHDAGMSGRDPVRASVPAMGLFEREYTWDNAYGGIMGAQRGAMFVYLVAAEDNTPGSVTPIL